MRRIALTLLFSCAGLVWCEVLPAAPKPLTVETWTLDEGTTVALVEDHRAPLVSLRLSFPVGRWSPWARRMGAAEAFRIQIHDPGSRLQKRADELASRISLDVGDRTSRLSLNCLKQDLPEVLNLVKEVLANTEFDRSELKRWNQGRRLDWSASQKDPLFVGVQAAVRQLFSKDDPRRLRWEKPAAVKTDRKALVAARDALLRLPGRTIGLAGDLTRDEASRAVRGLLPPADVSPPTDLLPRFDLLTPPGKRQASQTIPIDNLTQVYFTHGRESLTYNDRDYAAFLIADHVLGGHFYSRLYRALRHESGETYGAGTTNLGDVVIGPYGMTTFTRAENAEQTEKKLREVLRAFAESGITNDERTAAVGALRGQVADGRQAPEQVLDRYIRETALGLASGFLDHQVEIASRTRLSEVNRFIARWYNPAHFSMIRVAPK